MPLYISLNLSKISSVSVKILPMNIRLVYLKLNSEKPKSLIGNSFITFNQCFVLNLWEIPSATMYTFIERVSVNVNKLSNTTSSSLPI